LLDKTLLDKTLLDKTLLDETLLDNILLDKTLLDKTLLDKMLLDKTSLDKRTSYTWNLNFHFAGIPFFSSENDDGFFPCKTIKSVGQKDRFQHSVRPVIIIKVIRIKIQFFESKNFLIRGKNLKLFWMVGTIIPTRLEDFFSLKRLISPDQIQ
jgi:hypothetical protein